VLRFIRGDCGGCIGAANTEQVQRCRCRGAVTMHCTGFTQCTGAFAEVQVVQRCRCAQVQVQMCRSSAGLGGRAWCRGADVLRCRCRGAGVQQGWEAEE